MVDWAQNTSNLTIWGVLVFTFSVAKSVFKLEHYTHVLQEQMTGNCSRILSTVASWIFIPAAKSNHSDVIRVLLFVVLLNGSKSARGLSEGSGLNCFALY